MATSRSRARVPVTSRPSMNTAPSSTGSRPASIRMAVDLPLPEGPTRTRSSPSRMLRSSWDTAGGLPGSKMRDACLYSTVAMVLLRLSDGDGGDGIGAPA